MGNLKMVKKFMNKKRTGVLMLHRHGSQVLFFFFFLSLFLSMTGTHGFVKNQDFFLHGNTESGISVFIPMERGNLHMTMETYLVWMLFVTMPIDYEEEALKAQAILLRTELLRSHIRAGNEIVLEKNPELEEYSSRFFETIKKKEKTEYFQKLQKVVIATQGIYLIQDAEPAIAPWFKVSAGATRVGKEVLDCKEYENLVSTSCDRDYQAEAYLTKVSIKKYDYFQKLLKWIGHKEKAEKVELQEVEKDTVGYVLMFRFKITWKNGESTVAEISGENFRELFCLPSSHIVIKDTGKEIVFTVKGQGHGLGMSQFAANQLAKQGMDYVGILKTFFTNIAIDKIE